MTSTVYIALGSNVGDRSANLAAARAAIENIADTIVLAESCVEETEPVGPVDQPSYLNQMLAVRTSLEPNDLLVQLHKIERDCGRTRRERWGPRTLDLDIVRFGDMTVHTDALVIPHPEIENRDFWKREIDEIERMLIG